MSLACRRIISRLSVCQTPRLLINTAKNARFSGITSNRVCCVSTRRNYSEDASKHEGRFMPPLMSFPEIVWPSLIKTLKNFVFEYFIIRPHMDNDFSLPDFIAGSKQAVEVVSTALKDGDFNVLDDLVVPETITELRSAISKFSMTQREQIAINKDDIYFQFPYQIGVIFEESEKRWVEITMCFHVLKGFHQMQNNEGGVPVFSPEERKDYESKMAICNYRFIKEFTKGVEDSWRINVVNHFCPKDKK